MKQIQVMLVDDHELMRQGLRAILAMEEDILVIGEAGNGTECLERVRQGIRPDIVLMDVQMPGMSGVAATRTLASLLPKSRVVALSAMGDEETVESMLAAGARAFVQKSSAASNLVRVIRDVFEGRSRTAKGASATEAGHRAPRARAAADLGACMTRREREVMNILMLGSTNKEIAERLVISERTVQTHLSNIFHKLGVSSRTEAVLVAMRDGWIASELSR
ncbi:MAG: response regulator transcription factor [Caldilineaceae bacterium]|nr:response regulator transcription factor [Caldilineaceae bacterium]